jgi:mannose-6-phosphate isomerase-like protein (cupin superfamily)/uncharacterized protein YndB with AHSA1/START domain
VAKPGDALDIPALGMRIEFRATADETGGERLEYDVVGRPIGFVTQPHVHPAQVERHEVVSGATGIEMEGRERVLRPGEDVVIPKGTPHRHFAAGEGPGRVRVELRPALRTAEFLERLAELSREGRITRRGWPKPVAGARLTLDFPREGHPTRPPLEVQRLLARAITAPARARERGGGEYVFVDEWDVDAPAEAVFDAIADARTYPEWWRPVYIGVEAEGPPAVGQVSRQHFKGRLPYQLRTTSRIVRLDPPRVVEAEVDGDLRGRGIWTLTPSDGGTHVRFDWRVFADKPILRALTPVLRPAFRWNHNWAIARAMEGLEPYARRRASAAPEPSGAESRAG